MKTDVQLCKLFQSKPSYLADLLELDQIEEVGREFDVVSEVSKEIERRADLVWKSSKGPNQLIIEFQGYKDPTIYHRGELLRVLLSLKHLSKTVKLIIVFLHPSYDPQTQPWKGYLDAGNPLYEVVYLNEALEKLEGKNPEHPLVHTLSPIYVEDDTNLKEAVTKRFLRLRDSDLEEPDKRILEEIFLSLFTSRFGHIHLEALKNMLAPLMDLKDTAVFKEIFTEGKTEGEMLGKQEVIVALQRQLDEYDTFYNEGIFSKVQYKERRTAIEREIAIKKAEMDALQNRS